MEEQEPKPDLASRGSVLRVNHVEKGPSRLHATTGRISAAQVIAAAGDNRAKGVAAAEFFDQNAGRPCALPGVF